MLTMLFTQPAQAMTRAQRSVRFFAITGVLVAVGVAAAMAPQRIASPSRQTLSVAAAISYPKDDRNAWRARPTSSPAVASAPVAGAKPVAPPAAAAHSATGAPPRTAAPPPVRVLPAVAINSRQQALINADRTAAGLGPLSWSPCLASIAAQNAQRMAAQGFISHANGVTLDLGCHLDLRAGENVGYTTGGMNDALLNSMFMNSPEHRANILGQYRYVGTAWAVAPNGAAYIAVEFS